MSRSASESVSESVAVDVSPFGSRAPGLLDRIVLALTRSMPNNWLGLRLAILFRRIVTSRLGRGAIDTELWGMRLRLYPLGNGCEKNALFTPQMFDVMELGVLAAAIDCAVQCFVFVDIGANVGLYSLFVASRCGNRARILAIEPQPGILQRLRFNLAANPGVRVDVVPTAAADRAGRVNLILDSSDSGGAHIDKQNATRGAAGSHAVSVPCKTLAAILTEAEVSRTDALKIDVEGAEDLVLTCFLRDAPRGLLPELILIEDTRGLWQTDLFALLEQHGYTVIARSRHNVALRHTR